MQNEAVTSRARAEGAADSDGHAAHGELLVVAPVKDDGQSLRELTELLELIARPPGIDFEDNPVLPFRRLTRVHFARLLILPEEQGPPAPDGERPPVSRVPAQLVFASDFDGPLREHLQELVDVAAGGLDQLFGRCEGWTPLAGRDRGGRYLALAEFVGRHSPVANTFYVGTTNRSVTQIRREAELREAIEDYLDHHVGTVGFPDDPVGIHARVRTWAFSDPRFAWLHHRPGPMPTPNVPAFVSRHPQISAGAGVLAVLGGMTWLLARVLPLGWAMVPALVLAIGTIAAYLYLSYLNARDPVIIRRDAQSHVRALVGLEDHVFQNQITTVNYIKRPVWFRRAVLRLVLLVINGGARFIENQGTLSGIPSIHFARWVVVDQGRRLLFLSNFDGSWESYLGDFVDKAHKGLTAIWCNVVGFPRTRGLRGEGALDEQRFKAIARDSQVPTQVWYSAYPALTVTNVNDNTRLRLGLYVDLDDAGARAWLRMGAPRRRTGAGAPGPPAAVEEIDTPDVQGFVAKSYGVLHHAIYVPVALPEGAGARAWLQDLIPDLTPASRSSGQVKEDGAALNVAFTRCGLGAFGLSDETVVGFSREFREGMSGNEHRQRLLGDTGNAVPDRWLWGGPANPDIHAVLFVFAGSDAQLETLLSRERARARRHGVSVHERTLSTWWLGPKEHFGFDDGIAQPRIAGLKTDERRADQSPAIPAGEVLLGYRNAYGRIPISPTVGESARSARHLRPSAFDPAGNALPRDFGRNGSYVVFRQLQQDVRAFWTELDTRAGRDPARRKLLAAKMVGRWPNGAPITRFPCVEPQHDAARTANDFLYDDDLDGDRCPIGSHVRRTNPRAGLHPDTRESLKVSARHRLVRRGRAYGPPLSPGFDPDEILRSVGQADTERGLHFICFNTDIGRQFEFVQSAWMNSPKFDGLHGDPDPAIAPHPEPRKGHPEEISGFTVQQDPVRVRYRHLQQFVTMVGGCYLFMPGMKALHYLADDS